MAVGEGDVGPDGKFVPISQRGREQEGVPSGAETEGSAGNSPSETPLSEENRIDLEAKGMEAEAWLRMRDSG